MRSVLLDGPGAGDGPRPGSVRLVERAIPPVQPGDVRLAVEACSLCGTDFAACRFDAAGESTFSGPLRLPVVLGHEVAGTVASVGDGVSRVAIGDLVAVESVLSCWRCDACLSGSPAQCELGELLGLTRDGGLADFVSVPEQACFSLAPLLRVGLPRDEAAVVGALLEPFGAVYSALFLAGRPALPGDGVVIYGLGSLGLLAGAVARAAGCCPVVGVDRDPSRVEWAARHGFDEALALDMARGEPAAAAREIGRRLLRPGADVQLDASGSTDRVLPIAQRLLAPRGRLIVLSRTRQPVATEVNPWVSAAASLQGTRGRTDARAFSRLLALFASGRLEARPQIARFVPLAAIPEILLAGAESQAGKTMALVGARAPWEPAAERQVAAGRPGSGGA